tara:strand:- start:58 stop:1275 length:1218 start_codon:yes stop_codon:yes gene_type:complete
MSSRAGTYLPIRPSGYKPAPVPYFQELMNAQNLVGIGTAGLLSQAPNIIDNSKSILNSAQDVIDSHLNRDYKTYEGGYVQPTIIHTPEGVIYAPDPPEEKDWRDGILADPVQTPDPDSYTTGGEVPVIEDMNTTGGGLLETPTFEDLTSGGGFKILDEKDKLPIILKNLKNIYHGTDKDFDVFDVEQSSDGSIWFSDRKDKIESQEVGASGFGKIIERQIDENKINLAEGWSDEVEQLTTDQLIQSGYDGIKYSENGENTYQIFNPKKLLDVSYRLESPSEDNARLDDLTQTFPDDIYSSNAIRYYGNPNNLADIESNEIIQEARGNPDMEVTIYRAVPNDADISFINEGDFVTLSKTYAEEHGAGGYGSMGNEAGKILTKKVKVKDLVTGGNDLNEFGYYPVSQ